MEFKGILIEEQELLRKGKLNDEYKKKLEREGFKIVKKKGNENVITTFEDDKITLVCDKEEIIFRLLLLSSTITRIIITDKMTTVVIFSGRRSITQSFKITRQTSLEGLRKSYIASKSSQDFLQKYLTFLSENNDDAVIGWLKEFMKNKS
ncbi:hypothetical protein [Stygiolobus caldivivus]|uniref:Uncharacterized protein n=1 Tax=Stygiolobus caldivivus TaxID=2824673 RepID=A0A8D5ZIA0_9CREN|nr:hypothetical protein [Stygiolobus caldivivus]BCU69107.1 hypothetical protein KN1_04040 [Stygiolobus caldivivus]